MLPGSVRSQCSLGPTMAVSPDKEPANGKSLGDGRLSWPVLLLTFAVITTTSLSALSLYQLLALKADVELLKSEVCRRREEQQEARHKIQTLEKMCSRRGRAEPTVPAQSEPVTPLLRRRSRRRANATQIAVFQPCLQMFADNRRNTFQKEFSSEQHTGIPWQTGLTRGSALEVDNNSMVVREEGFYFLYSQVYYMDSTFAMGHVVIRRKRNVVGDEPQHVILFRCIQAMNPVYPYNTCYTGGIVKLEALDQVELLIPRSTANVALEGDSTFMGAVKLA